MFRWRSLKKTMEYFAINNSLFKLPEKWNFAAKWLGPNLDNLKVDIEISLKWRSLPLICPLKKFFGSTSAIWFGQTKKKFQWANQGQTVPSMGKFYI
ncbi:unnamed protein product [Blepharisma stoltei]|uniref:Uncharacterized protein n=1 Tax=Blepharisma stoltei TaxID=1481888 RepID=A0AAU9IGQ6_9CILI|nr:unnamed protein product [Blepharisma stoltei]